MVESSGEHPQQAHDVEMTSLRRCEVASTSLRGHVLAWSLRE